MASLPTIRNLNLDQQEVCGGLSKTLLRDPLSSLKVAYSFRVQATLIRLKLCLSPHLPQHLNF